MSIQDKFDREILLRNARFKGRDYHAKFKEFLNGIPPINQMTKRQVIIKFLGWCEENQLGFPPFFETYEIFRLSLSTYERAVDAYTHKDECIEKNSKGRPTLFPDAFLPELTAWVIKRQNKKILPSRGEITDKANKILRQNGIETTLSDKWIDSFLKLEKCPFKKSSAAPIEEERYEVSPDVIREWFSLLSQVDAAEVIPELLINLDETGFGKTKKSQGKSKTVVVTKDTDDSSLLYAEKNDEGHVTVVTAITASGDMLKPLFVHKNKTLHEDAKKCTFYRNVYYSHTSSAFISTAIYNKYIEDEIIPYIEKTRTLLGKLDARAILIVDGLKSHNNEYINSTLAQHHIEYLMMPAHSSHILQPLDRYFFHAVKQAYSRCKKRKDINSITGNLERIYNAIQSAAITVNILRSWDHAGIVPVIEEGIVSKVIFEVDKLKKHTSSLFNGIVDESGDSDEGVSIPKSGKRISEKNSEWGHINEEHMHMFNKGVCPLCGNKIESTDETSKKL